MMLVKETVMPMQQPDVPISLNSWVASGSFDWDGWCHANVMRVHVWGS